MQSDGYAACNTVCEKNKITHVGCWDHARRKFVKSSKVVSATKQKKNKVSKADVALSKINELYRIERTLKELSPEQRQAQRQLLSVPLLDELKIWLDINISKVVKESLTWQAIDYTLNQWDKLIAYCDDGQVHISNILAENAICPFAIGRKNGLFSDTPRGAHASATCYSLIETAKANGLEPGQYIQYVLKNIADADTLEKLEALLPWNMPETTL